MPKEADANEAVEQTMMDQRKLRRGFLSSVQAGDSGTGAAPGNSFLG